MIENFIDLLKVFVQTSLIFGALLLVYRKYIFSVFDPLAYFLMTQAFSIQLGLIEITTFSYLLNFIFCQICFTIGFLLSAQKIKGIYKIDDRDFQLTESMHKGLSYFTLFGFIVILLANLLLISQKGVLILSSDPSLSKISAFEDGGGLGAVRRINWGLLTLDGLCAIFLYLKTSRKRYLAITLILILILLSGGTKGAVLIFIFIISMIGSSSQLRETRNYQKLKQFQVVILAVALVSAIFIIAAKFGNLSQSILSLGLRFLYFGDAILYYYTKETVTHFQQLNVFDFLNYEFNSLLGLLRIVPYTLPLGFQMVEYSLTHNETLENVFGPNMPYYIKGHIYFGTFGALLYSLFVGSVIGYSRKLLFTLNRKSINYIFFLLIVFLNIEIIAYPQDSAFFITVITDTFFFSSVPILLAYYCLLPVKSTLTKMT